MSFIYASFLWLLIPLLVYLFKREKSQHFSQNLRWVVLALLIVALARPVLSEKLGLEQIRAHSLVIALDLSGSMNANDIKPNRAKVSKEIIKRFLEENHHEQISLMGFTINPLLLSPPTTDHKLLLLALENVNSEYILTKGTDLKKLFEKIAKFKDEEKKVILFSDGGDEFLGEELIEFVQKEKIKILVIAMATKQGASVTQKNGKLIVDKEGHIVVSKLNGSLKALAEGSRGVLISFISVEDTVSSIENWLKNEKILNDILYRESKHYFSLTFVPLSLALILFFISATKFSKKLLVFLVFLGLNLQAEELLIKEHWGEGINKLTSESSEWAFLDAYYLQRAYVQYTKKEYVQSQENVYKIKNKNLETTLLLAHVFYKQAKYKQAKLILKSIKSTNKKLKQQLYYELGNCEAKLLYMKKAKDYYLKALQLGKDDDALHNLEVVINQEKENSFKVGYQNPSEAQKSKEKSDNLQVDKEALSSKKDKSLGSAGGSGSKKSKKSTVKVVKVEEESSPKRLLSSKSYDLINEGFISEEKPW